MSVSIRVTMTRPNTGTVWPFDIWADITGANYQILEEAGLESWIDGNEDTNLEIIVDHHFPTNDLFSSFKTNAYQHIPLWKTTANADETASYIADNGITVNIIEVADPDLSSFERILVNRSDVRGI